MRAPRPLRIFVALFNTIVALALAGFINIGPQALRPEVAAASPLTWWVAGAAATALLAVLLDAAVLGWMAIGFLLFAALSGVVLPVGVLFLALAVSLTPVLPRPGGSVLAGLLIAAGTAAAVAVAWTALPL